MGKLTRVEFGAKLRAVDPEAHTYFQQPSSVRIAYPCFIYSRDTGHTARADNRRYIHAEGYSVIYITTDPDSEIPQKVLDVFPYSSDEKPYVKDGLYHYPFTIYNN